MSTEFKRVVDLTGKSQLTALIDADSIIYIIAWNNREHNDVAKVLEEVDQFITDILVELQARQYAGFFTPKHYFRYDIATYKPYKGTRPETPEWVTKWKPYIIQHCIDKWNFVLPVDMEADDAVAILQHSMDNSTICSPDKDLKQVPGNHYDYKTGTRVFVTEEQALRTFWYQMLIGDTSDNIAGVPKIGPKGADLLLDSTKPEEYKVAVKAAFIKFFGDVEGIKMYNETFALIRMLGPWSLLPESLHNIKELSIQPFDLDNAKKSEYIAPIKEQEQPFIDPFAE